MEYLVSLPAELRIPGALEEIRSRVAESGRRVVVLDGDPTGTQTVHGVPVLTTWSVEDLRGALRGPSPTFYVLTNSRSFPEGEAVEINREIASNLALAAEQAGVEVVLTSRGDSTLRGHYPAETDALREALGADFDGVILCHCYLEAGRITVEDVHWVRQGGTLVPAGETEFARDASFGYSSSGLLAWVEEKTAGRVPASEVASVGFAEIREGLGGSRRSCTGWAVGVLWWSTRPPTPTSRFSSWGCSTRRSAASVSCTGRSLRSCGCVGVYRRRYRLARGSCTGVVRGGDTGSYS